MKDIDEDKSRRTFIKWITALAGSSLLSPCFSLARTCGITINIPHIQTEKLPASDSKFKFAIFDCHTHIFNARDLQIKGYLEGPIAHDVEKNSPALAKVIRMVAGMIQSFGYEFSPSAGDEVEKLSEPVYSLRLAGSKGVSEDENHTRNLLVTLLNKIELKKRLKIAAEQEKESLSSFLISDTPYDRPEVDSILDAYLPRNQDKFKLLQDKKEIGFIAFLRNALSYRFQNVQHLWDEYDGSSQKFRPDAYFISLVDFDYLLEPPGQHSGTPTCIEDQILLSEALIKRYGGAVLPLAPYNPWTDRKQNGQSFRDVQDAIENHGFVGVKIYPTLGFAPYGNAEVGVNNPPAIWKQIEPGTDPAVIGKELDQNLLRLLTWCAQNEVPIMAHNGCTMGPDKDAIDLAGPDYWEQALEVSYKAAKKPLRVNLGHFGGEDDCYCNPEDQYCWQKNFIKLMNKPEGRWLYADIAYWRVFLRDDHQTNKFLAQNLAYGQTLRSHLMYGSDWYMLSNEKNYVYYAENIRNWADKIDPSGNLTVQLFHANIAEFFGLHARDKSGKTPVTRARLMAYYKKNEIPTPSWMRKLS